MSYIGPIYFLRVVLLYVPIFPCLGSLATNRGPSDTPGSVGGWGPWGGGVGGWGGERGERGDTQNTSPDTPKILGVFFSEKKNCGVVLGHDMLPKIQGVFF